MIEEQESREHINNKIEEYLGCANLENREKIFDRFYEPLINKHKFKEEWGNTVVPNCNGTIELIMTTRHKRQYLKILTKKLRDYRELVETNKEVCRYYKTPVFELSKAQGFAREAFNESFLMAKDSYKPKLREYHESIKEKNDLSKSKKNKISRSKRKKYVKLPEEIASEFKKLQRLHLDK